MGVWLSVLPSDNWSIERVIQTLINKIRKLAQFGKYEWSKFLEDAILAVNLSFNRSINTSPFIYCKGKLPELDIDKEMN